MRNMKMASTGEAAGYTPLSISTDGDAPVVEGKDQVKTAALLALLHASDDEVFAAILRLAQSRPTLILLAVAEAGLDLSAFRSSSSADIIDSSRSRDAEQAAKPEDSAENAQLQLKTDKGNSLPTRVLSRPSLRRCTVQFATKTYYVDEGTAEAEIEVIRFGDISGDSQVRFQTRNGSAIAGERFMYKEGTIAFAPWENAQKVCIPIISDERWGTTAAFSVHLLEEGLDNVVLGHGAQAAHVKIIDDDVFPSNVYRLEIQDQNLDDIPKAGLVWEYIKFNLGFAKVNSRTRKILLLDLLRNAFFLLRLFVNVVLVDMVLNPSVHLSGSKSVSLLMVVAITVLPFATLHVLDHMKYSNFGIGGSSRYFIQLGLFRKFLEIDQGSRQDLSSSQFITAMTTDVTDVVANGYGSFLKLIRAFGELTVMLMYQFLAPVIFGKKFSVVGLLPVIFFPPIMLMWLRFRAGITGECINTKKDCMNALLELVSKTVQNFKLVVGYDQSYAFSETFEQEVRAYNKGARETNVVLNNNAYFALWLSHMVVAGWTMFGGLQVLNGTLSLGMFLTNMHIFSNIGGAWVDIYGFVTDIYKIIPGLERITVLMNLPTDLAVMQKLGGKFQEDAQSYQLAARTPTSRASEPYIDLMPIKFGNLNFVHRMRYVECGKATHITHEMNFKGQIRFPQGEIIGLLGSKGSGKTTLLNLLGGALFTEAGESELSIPAHVRVLHIPYEPMFVPGSLRDNLIFGLHKDDEDSRDSRVMAICARLGLDGDFMQHMDRIMDWSELLSGSQARRVSIARALIMNPEVLCLHKPTEGFSESLARSINTIFREFVDNRGVEQDELARPARRLRTLLITATTFLDMEQADRLLKVHKTGRLQTLWPKTEDSGDVPRKSVRGDKFDLWQKRQLSASIDSMEAKDDGSEDDKGQ